jgi:cephalosporin hydroxylase
MSIVRQWQRAIAHEIRTVRGAAYRRLYTSRRHETSTVDAFHRLYFDARAFNMTWRNTYWLGHPILKCPLDLWLYQEILHQVRPDLILETGTAYGGSALFLASMCDLIGTGRVVSIDAEARPGLPVHPRVEYVVGSSVSEAVLGRIRAYAAQASTVMVILDSDHARDHVVAELRAYAPLVTPGSFLIVEDTNLNGHPIAPDHGPGPMEALEQFLPDHPEFAHDPATDKFFLTFNPKGFLRRAR